MLAFKEHSRHIFLHEDDNGHHDDGAWFVNFFFTSRAACVGEMKVCGLSWRRLVQCLLTGLLTAGVLYCFLYFHFSRHPHSYPTSHLDLQASTSLPISPHAVTWSGAGHDVTERAASEGMQHLREFQSAAHHYWRKLQDLLVARNRAKFPSVSYWNCSCLWESDADNHTGNATLLTTNVTRLKTPQDYLAETQNCTRFVLHGGFKMAAVSEEELAFPLAFSLLVYKDLDQVGGPRQVLNVIRESKHGNTSVGRTCLEL